MGLFNKNKNAENNQPEMPPNFNSQPMPDMNMQDPYGQAPDYGQMPPQGMQDPYSQQQGYSQDYNQMPPPQQGGQDPYAQQQGYPPNQQFDPNVSYQDDTKERVEEIAEAIIDEKWNELIKDINKVIEWKERTDGEIKKIQQEIANLKERFESLHKGVLGKITEYDKNLTNVGTEIKAMEMTFQKILPTFTENVNKLDRIVKGSKG